MKSLIALSLAAAMLVASPTLAQMRAPTDHAAAVTRADAAAAADRRFAALDANRDGTVTAAERQAARRQRAARVVTAADFQARARTRFDRLDANHDGKLTGEERQAGRPGGWQHARRGDGERMASAQPVTQADFRTRALARFDRIDANHDGRIDPAERAAAAARLRHGRDRSVQG